MYQKNFSYIGQELLKLQADVQVRAAAKCDSQRADFQETPARSFMPNFIEIRWVKANR
jgi:hypothetical protein